MQSGHHQSDSISNLVLISLRPISDFPGCFRYDSTAEWHELLHQLFLSIFKQLYEISICVFLTWWSWLQWMQEVLLVEWSAGNVLSITGRILLDFHLAFYFRHGNDIVSHASQQNYLYPLFYLCFINISLDFNFSFPFIDQHILIYR